MHLVSRVRYSSLQSDPQARGATKHLLKFASRQLNSIMICVIILLAVCVFVSNSLLLDRVFSALSKLRYIGPSALTKTFHHIPISNDSFLGSLKSPSISLSFRELMEYTNDGWLSYYRSHERQLSRMSPTQIMCAYQCWSDRRCLGFLHREALRRMCNLIRSTHSRCCNASLFAANYQVSFGIPRSLYLQTRQVSRVRF